MSAHYSSELAAVNCAFALFVRGLPISAHRCTAGNNVDISGKPTGKRRTVKKYKSKDVWTWDDFEYYGWTRSLSDNWMNDIP